jgi:hypothetical protein
VLNLLVATDGVVAELGADVRRLRPNLLMVSLQPITAEPERIGGWVVGRPYPA